MRFHMPVDPYVEIYCYSSDNSFREVNNCHVFFGHISMQSCETCESQNELADVALCAVHASMGSIQFSYEFLYLYGRCFYFLQKLVSPLKLLPPDPAADFCHEQCFRVGILLAGVL